MKVEQLNGYKNQFLITNETQKTFQSYNSKIAILSWINGNAYLRVFSDWDYSKTTMRHFKRFINEETPFNYGDSKQWRLEMKNNENIEEV